MNMLLTSRYNCVQQYLMKLVKGCILIRIINISHILLKEVNLIPWKARVPPPMVGILLKTILMVNINGVC